MPVPKQFPPATAYLHQVVPTVHQRPPLLHRLLIINLPAIQSLVPLLLSLAPRLLALPPDPMLSTSKGKLRRLKAPQPLQVCLRGLFSLYDTGLTLVNLVYLHRNYEHSACYRRYRSRCGCGCWSRRCCRCTHASQTQGRWLVTFIHRIVVHIYATVDCVCDIHVSFLIIAITEVQRARRAVELATRNVV